jgi:ABC-type multidrug transport system ATPase subunit
VDTLSHLILILQDDYLYPHLTVRETLLLQAQFFMSADISRQQREAFVDDVILELGLLKAQHTMIGGAKVRGVSGGERKRVSIATQLITDPSILFLDEPTSGLDGFQAQSVMEAMKNMTTNNRSALLLSLSIPSPSPLVQSRDGSDSPTPLLNLRDV